MHYNPDKHHRHSIRLKGFDYSQAGLYFITICVQGKVCLFGKVGVSNKEGDHEGRPYDGRISSKMIFLNDAGEMVKREWLKIPNRFPNVRLHEFVIMPNHFHGIIEIIGQSIDDVPVGATLVVAPPSETMKNDKISMRNNGATLEHVGDTMENDGMTLKNNGAIMENNGAIICNNGATMEHNGATTRVAPTVGQIIAAFKSIVTVEYIRGVKHLGWKPFADSLWQRNYWEHIIRDYQTYQNISLYIVTNPENWQSDILISIED